jgi:hypothetical protein
VTQRTAGDFPVPAALRGGPEFIWDDTAVPAENLVVAVSTNTGSLSEDLLNRALPIHLAPKRCKTRYRFHTTETVTVPEDEPPTEVTGP